jgi:3'-phosphoadenosine 5'-phosphosulfate sulfotransferase
MNQLKSLVPVNWEAVDIQAASVYSAIKSAQAKNEYEAKFPGSIHQVNAEILRTNGFRVNQDADCFIVCWGGESCCAYTECQCATPLDTNHVFEAFKMFIDAAAKNDK